MVRTKAAPARKTISNAELDNVSRRSSDLLDFDTMSTNSLDLLDFQSEEEDNRHTGVKRGRESTPEAEPGDMPHKKNLKLISNATPRMKFIGIKELQRLRQTQNDSGEMMMSRPDNDDVVAAPPRPGGVFYPRIAGTDDVRAAVQRPQPETHRFHPSVASRIGGTSPRMDPFSPRNTGITRPRAVYCKYNSRKKACHRSNTKSETGSLYCRYDTGEKLCRPKTCRFIAKTHECKPTKHFRFEKVGYCDMRRGKGKFACKLGKVPGPRRRTKKSQENE